MIARKTLTFPVLMQALKHTHDTGARLDKLLTYEGVTSDLVEKFEALVAPEKKKKPAAKRTVSRKINKAA